MNMNSQLSNRPTVNFFFSIFRSLWVQMVCLAVMGIFMGLVLSFWGDYIRSSGFYYYINTAITWTSICFAMFMSSYILGRTQRMIQPLFAAPCATLLLFSIPMLFILSEGIIAVDWIMFGFLPFAVISSLVGSLLGQKTKGRRLWSFTA